MRRSICKMALLILFHPLQKELGYRITDEDMHASYQVSPLREMDRRGKALASTKVPGIHQGHLEAIESGWKLDLFLKGVSVDSEPYEIYNKISKIVKQFTTTNSK